MRHALQDPCEQLLVAERVWLAADMLRRADAYPAAGDRCLEVGYGRLGWLGQLVAWGVPTSALHGIELDPERAAVARGRLPDADLRIGDAKQMPWPAGRFRLVVASTVFTSVCRDADRRALAEEIARVTAPGGAVLVYDFRFESPRNEEVRKVSKRELLRLFPGMRPSVRSLSLAPPLARRIAPLSPRTAWLLSTIPFLRTHLLGVFVRPGE